MRLSKIALFPFKSKKRLLLSFLILAGLVFLYPKVFGTKTAAPTYQTAVAEKGTLVTSISASGNVTSGNRLNITTAASGTVSRVYVKNGDTVTQGQKIADILLDQDSAQKQSSAWASYLSAKNQLASAQSSIYTLQAAEFSANQKFMNDAIMRGLDPTDPTYIQENALWLKSQADYLNQSNVISQVQASLNSAWLNYQQYSSTIIAPTSGTVGDLILAQGLPITAQTSSSSNSNTSQTVGDITLPQGHIQAIVNLSEIDSPQVKPGQKVTLTLDAFPTKTFTGKILLVDTNGAVSSGVTTYPVTIDFDTSAPDIYPNMAVTAQIITSVKDNVLLVPSAAVQTTNGQISIRLLTNNKITVVPVEVGSANDTQTEITSGIKEGDTVVTSVITSSTTTGSAATSGSASPFGSFGAGAAGRTGGANRVFVSGGR